MERCEARNNESVAGVDDKSNKQFFVRMSRECFLRGTKEKEQQKHGADEEQPSAVLPLW